MKLELRMEVLTPLHVGSGEEMLKGIDFIGQDGLPHVVDQYAVFERLAERGISDVGAVRGIGDLLRYLNGEAPGYSLTLLHGGKSVPEHIRQQLKDAHGRPLIPGSSLKGAIRTALLAKALRRQAPSRRDVPFFDRNKKSPSVAARHASQKITKSYFGRTPNLDWMRIWKVGDVAFGTDALRLADVRFLNLAGDPPSLRWKDMSTRKSLTAWRDAHGIHVEVLNPGAVAACAIVLDDVLYQKASNRLHWEQATHDFEGLRSVLNAHARHRLAREWDFYRQYGHEAAARVCEQVQTIMKRDGKAVYMQMGWGSGWRGMTGDWQHDAGIEEEMRKLYRLGRKNHPIFPKTRRLTVSGGEPSLPLGWVRLWLEADEGAIRRGGVSASQKKASPAQVARAKVQREQRHHETDANELACKMAELKRLGIGGKRK